jgi:hypothetical protein
MENALKMRIKKIREILASEVQGKIQIAWYCH